VPPSDPAPNFGQIGDQLAPFSFEGLPDLPDSIAEYCRFYEIDFGDALAVEHRAGTIELDGCTLAVQSWLPQRARGTAFIVHGYFDHVGIYRHPIGYFLRRGYAVVSYDQPGHGLSSGERASIGDFSDYVNALHNVMKLAASSCPRPWHILGQSMGGAVIMTHLLAREFSNATSPFEEIVLLAPLVYPRGWLLGRVLHTLLHRFVQTRPRTYANNSHDRAFVDFITHRDTLQPTRLPMQWIAALKRWTAEFEALPVSTLTPVVFQGTDDDTVDWQSNMREVALKFPGATTHYVSGARHQMVNESAEFRAKIFGLLDDRFGTADSE